MLTAEIIQALTPEPTGPTLIITIGNAWRSDDGLGPYIAAQIKRLRNGLVLIDAGEKPENVITEAVKVKPAKVVIIDAADFQGRAGEARLISSAHMPETTLSTHTFPLKATVKMIENDTRALVCFLGVQAKRTSLGEGLSPEVKAAGDELIKLLNE